MDTCKFNVDQKFWLILVLTITLGLCLIVGTLILDGYLEYKTMATNGYEEVTVVGYNYPVWQKVERR